MEKRERAGEDEKDFFRACASRRSTEGTCLVELTNEKLGVI